MEEGGGHGFFCSCFLEDGEEEDGFFFLVVFVVRFLFGWLGGLSSLVSCLR